tara:strand:- start:1887 stop:2111 length:225 start_codon:yes stop_codon:yes gene_type:complete
MGVMKRISMLCEKEDRKGLINLLNMNDLTGLTNKTAEEIADDFILAHKNIRKRRNDEAYKKLNEIHDEFQNDNN